MCRQAVELMYLVILAIPTRDYHPKNEPWSQIEDEYLKTLYRRSMEAVQKALPNRTAEAIRQRAKRLGITQTTWLQDEDQILISLYDREGPRACQQHLRNRSINAIIKRASKLRRERFNRMQRLAFCSKWAAGQ